MSLSEPDAVFLADRNLTFLFALRPDGSPAGWPMTSVLADGALTFSSYAKAAKVRTCLAAGHATALAVRRTGEEIVRAVCVSGPVRLAEPGGPTGSGRATAMEVPAQVRERAQSATAEGKRVTLALDVAAGAAWSTGQTGRPGRPPVPKRDIRMSDAEIAAFLGRHAGCVFGYNDGGPAPAVLSGTYTLSGGVLRVSAERPGAAVRALRADPRVYLIVEESPSYYEIGYVGIEGSAERIQDTAGRLTFDLTPRAVTSASFAKLAKPAG